MFEAVLELESVGRRRALGKTASFLISLVTHAGVVLAIVGASWLIMTTVEDPQFLISFTVGAPPPPPPPPKGAAKQRIEEKRLEQPTRPEELTQPSVVPETIDMPAKLEEEGVEGGVEGGVPGGVPGGVVGGVVGAVLGGVLGGVPGGTLGGVLGAEGDEPLIVVGDIRRPELIVRVEPAYPEMARRARIEGRVILQAVIDTHGNVADVQVLKSVPLLDASAIEAVKKWKYTPASQLGRPVKVYFTVVVEFSLR